MERRDAILLLLLTGGIGYAVHKNWDAIRDKLGLDDLRPGRIKAMEIVKKQHSFDRNVQNWQWLKDRQDGGDIKLKGDPWLAVEVKSPNYRVTCSYTERGQPVCMGFNVNVTSSVVEFLGEVEPSAAAPR